MLAMLCATHGWTISDVVHLRLRWARRQFEFGKAVDLPDQLRHNPRMQRFAPIWLGFVLGFSLLSTAFASPALAPGDTQLRHDLQFLNDTGVINIPLTAWPLAAGDIRAALDNAEYHAPNSPAAIVFNRLKQRLRAEMDID